MTPAERVARGVALLDRVRPGWWGAVDLGELDMTKSCGCVLGHVFRAPGGRAWVDSGFARGVAQLADVARVFDPGSTGPMLSSAAKQFTIAHGFDAQEDSAATGDYDAEDYFALQEAWTRVIAERQAVTP